MENRSPFALDPFVFPAETKGRFRMLIAAALAFAWSLSAWFVHVPNIYTYASQVEPEVQAAFDKLRQSGNPSAVTRQDVQVFAEAESTKKIVRVLLFQAVRLVLSFAFLAAFGFGTWALYRLHPVLLRRRHRTVPLTSPAATEEVRKLTGRAGLASEPYLECKPGLLDGLAFGRSGREVLAIAGTPRLLGRAWNDLTRAVALHEIGHVVNDDVRSRELSRAMWIVLPVLGALATAGVALASLAHGELRFPVLQPAAFAGNPAVRGTAVLVSTVVKTAVSFFVVWWIWAGLIRAREHYADHRVNSWGFRKPLLLLLQLPESSQPWWRHRRLGKLFYKSCRDRPWWGSWTSHWESYGWGRHPSKTARIHALREPIVLFRAGPDLAFLTGLLLALLGAQMTPLSTDLTSLAGLLAAPLFFLFGPLAMLVFVGIALGVMLAVTWLVTGALGVQVRREAVADLATRPHHEWGYLRLGKTAFFFALGLETGLLISPFGPFSTTRSPWWVLAWLLGFALLVWMWLLYLRATTRLFLGPQTGPSVPKWIGRWLTGTSMLLLTVLFWPALGFRMTIEIASRDTLLAAMTPVSSTPSEFFAYMFLMTSLVLFSFGLMLYITIMTLCVLGAAIRMFRQREHCPSCGEPIPFKLVIGRRCASCGEALAAWLLEHCESQVT